MQQFFTSESVSEGHPDKVCDQISDAVVDLFLRADPRSRTAIETLATTNQVVIAGETKCNEYISAEMIEQTVRDTIRRIGYDQKGFSWQTVKIKNYLHHQSCDIALGVDRDGAGDQGIMFGYAKKEKGFDSDYMPLAIYWADRILQNLAQARHSGEIIGIEPDAKSQVTLEYDEDGTPKGIKTIVLSTQHNENLSQEEVRRIACRYVEQTLPAGWMPADKDILINPTGRFVIGGPNGDSGLTGRKIIVDTYGGYARHGGGAFSGKDCTKVDRSAAYAARYVAKNIVAAGLADKCEIQLSYAIGVAHPTSIMVDTFGTGKLSNEKFVEIIRENFDLRPAGIIKMLDLRRPIYKQTAAYGHFGRNDIDVPWEKTDKVDVLAKYAK